MYSMVHLDRNHDRRHPKLLFNTIGDLLITRSAAYKQSMAPPDGFAIYFIVSG